MKRRDFLVSAIAAVAASSASANAVPITYQPQLVDLTTSQRAGVIHVNTDQRFLYLTLGGTQAIRYGVAVGAAGRAFKGQATIRRKVEWPSWTPTTNMIRQEPNVYGPYRAGLPGGHPENPMGARGLYLYRGNRDTMFRIHGTHQPWTIGQSFSSGCIRLHNDHIADLYARVPIGTRVIVT
ncbi:L,D-transpeptidase [Yoonia sp. 208BN28-4]|uniref:L,D-transpeptidase n=1 Tax=Yoonia sp. 208BN28-4 TaxID=3126505 RepID=UPI0030A45227